MERKVKRAAIVSRSTAADNEETEASKRERECVCVLAPRELLQR